MEILLLSGTTEYIEWNDYGRPTWFDISKTNHQEYATQHGIKYLPIVSPNTDVQGYHPTWLKVKLITEAIEKSKWDWVVWIDADACFTDLSIDLRKWLIEGCNWVLPKQHPDPSTGTCWTSLNTGFMAVRSNSFTLSVLKEMWENPGYFRYGGFHEQSWLSSYFSNQVSNCSNLRDSLTEDLAEEVFFDDLQVIPFRFHLTSIEENIPFTYHAGGNTPTKTERVKQVLDRNL